MDWHLPEPFLHQLLSKCQPSDVARFACVSHRWRTVTSDDSIWMDFCLRYFDVSTTHDHLGCPCSSFKETFRIWHTNFLNYPSFLVIRGKRLWERLRLWMESNFPEVASTLQSGASEKELDEVEEGLGLKLPMPVRVLYRFCNGQDTHWGDFDEDDHAPGGQQNYVGLLGGYDFYHHIVNVHLLPLGQVVWFSQHYLRRWGTPTGSEHVIVAASCNLNKFYLLDCKDGMVYVGTRRLVTDGEMMPCVPFMQNGARCENYFAPQDAMLRWMEQYSFQLETGTFGLRKHDGVCSISTFPEKEPLCTEAVTYGVQVRCSAVFVPELSSLQDDDDDKYFFSYSVRMRLLPSGMGSSYYPFFSCQLYKRHWIIRADGVIVSEVRGEAVIGMFPLLQPDDKTFIYSSCTALTSSSGSIEGDFTFAPGKLSRREGADFFVRVAPFPLEVPCFIF